MRGWTKEDEQFLRDNYGKMAGKEIAKKLGRTIGAVYRKARVLGITRRCVRKEWTTEKERQLRRMLRCGKYTYREMAEKLGMTIRCVSYRVYKGDIWTEDVAKEAM
ncbi:MAG: hypothetical protein PHO72_02420 [Sphaerochaeta sp.]|nr:hypothetical protein [Sphaerochaeta sp.]